MAARHGTRARYKSGCHCDECRAAQAAYQARYRDRLLNGPPVAPELQAAGPGPVEVGVQAEIEIAGLGSGSPALVAVAVALSKVLDHPRAQSSKPAAAGQLVRVLDELHKGAARHPRGGLKLVRSMTTPKGGKPTG
jgi:hypothetical protein